MTDKEKLIKIKSLADKMADTAFNMTTEASLLKKEMDEYHQFIINEYHKEEQIIKELQEKPVSEELEKAANEWDAKASFTPFYMTLDNKGNPNGVRQDYTTHAESFKAGAKWQKQKDFQYVKKECERTGSCCDNDIAIEAAKRHPYCYASEMEAYANIGFKEGAMWQKEQIKEVLLSEALPYFMNGGEADEVVGKLEEVLNQKK